MSPIIRSLANVAKRCRMHDSRLLHVYIAAVVTLTLLLLMLHAARVNG